MNAELSLDKSVGQLVAEHPARSRVFEKLGIDYCCGGKLALGEACARKSLDPKHVLAELESADSQAMLQDGPDPTAISLTELCEHIVARHHEYLRTELPRIAQMSNKVASRHGDHYPWLIELDAVFKALEEELTLHMMKEEQILFPAIRDLEAGRPAQSSCGGHLAAPIAMMEHEHDDAGRALERMRELSGGYKPPADACNTFLALLDALAVLETDLHQHIHKENNVLFPKAMALVPDRVLKN
jgi:regulator of cell morphogenesis and NO signaling